MLLPLPPRPLQATPKLKMTYFNIKARAEPSRLALHIGGVPFEDVRIPFDAWARIKPTMPYAQVPLLEVDGKPLAQSYAILMFCGRLAGLVPQDPFLAAKARAPQRPSRPHLPVTTTTSSADCVAVRVTYMLRAVAQ